MNRTLCTLLAATLLPLTACDDATKPAPSDAPGAPAVVVSQAALAGVPAKRLERPATPEPNVEPEPAPPRVATLPRVFPAPALPAASVPAGASHARPEGPTPLAVAPPKRGPAHRDPKPARAIKPAIKPAVVVGDALEIVDSALATTVEDRVPLGVATTFTDDVGYIWAWTKVKNRVALTHITHVWKRDGKVRARVGLRVGKSPGWRTWSKKRISAKDVGAWEVEVLADDGTLLDTLTFDIAPLSDDPLAGQ